MQEQQENFSQTPLIFFRDELDLIEEDIDAMFEKYQTKTLGRKPMGEAKKGSLEALFLRELSETERHAKSILSLGMQSKDICFISRNDDFQNDKNMSWRLRLKEESIRHPLYEQVFIWMDRVCDVVDSLMTFSKHNNPEVFRVLLNAQMVPLKIFSSPQEVLEAPKQIKRILLSDYELACVYFERTLESLEQIREPNNLLYDRLIVEGNVLLGHIKKVNLFFQKHVNV